MATSNCLEIATQSPASFSLLLKTGALIHLPKPALMGIINVSPDSFFRSYDSVDAVLSCVESMITAGAVIIDVGGEATNPGVSLDGDGPSITQEIARVVPVVSAIKKHFNILVSVDTSKPAVMDASIMAGADMINDQRSLRAQGAVEVIARHHVPVCLMHAFNPPRHPGSCSPHQLIQKIKSDLCQSIEYCHAAGVDDQRIIIDPGFGQGHFGKNCQENYYLLAQLTEFSDLSYPLLTGWSRKSMIGEVLNGAAAEARLYGSIAADTIAAINGASIIRTHDVQATRDAIEVARYYNATRTMEN